MPTVMVALTLLMLLLPVADVAAMADELNAPALAGSQNQSVKDALIPRRVRPWITAVQEHQPGQDDAALKRIQAWTPEDLRTLQEDLVRLLLGRPPPIETALLGLDRAEIRDPILRRGAMLHADVAMLRPFGAPYVGGGSRTIGGLSGVLVDDGLTGGFRTNSLHWAVGRQLLDLLSSPSSDAFVDLWYRATIGFMLATSDYAAVETQLARAQKVLPNKPHVWLALGAVHEYYATAVVQSAASGLKLPPGSVLMVGGARAELDRAEEAFRRAVSFDRESPEANLRLGRVLALKHRYEEAAVELRSAATTAVEPLLQYYAFLFLGQVEGALQQRGAARTSFEHAAALFPNAQTPMLALSELAASGDDRTAADAALRPLFALPAQVEARADPWWSYDVSYGRHWAALVAQLRSSFAREPR